MNRASFSANIQEFLALDSEKILGSLTAASEFSVDPTQRHAWEVEIQILKRVLSPYAAEGKVYFEYAVPRLGKRIDVIALIRSTILVLEFKVGETEFERHARDQVWDYALDLKNFHEASHDKILVPVLIATAAEASPAPLEKSAMDDGVFRRFMRTPTLCRRSSNTH